MPELIIEKEVQSWMDESKITALKKSLIHYGAINVWEEIKNDGTRCIYFDSSQQVFDLIKSKFQDPSLRIICKIQK